MRSLQRDVPNSSRDIVEELIGEESEDNYTHRPDGTHNILNEVVIDRGPNASKSFARSLNSKFKKLTMW